VILIIIIINIIIIIIIIIINIFIIIIIIKQACNKSVHIYTVTLWRYKAFLELDVGIKHLLVSSLN